MKRYIVITTAKAMQLMGRIHGTTNARPIWGHPRGALRMESIDILRQVGGSARMEVSVVPERRNLRQEDWSEIEEAVLIEE